MRLKPNMLYIVANFKSHKTEDEAKNWLEKFKSYISDEGKTVIICPPFTLLPLFKNFVQENSVNVSLGAQNVSHFEEGPYTGEENAKQIKEFADYVLIGHSERRINFKEDDYILTKKIEAALKYALNPIFFVQSKETNIPQGVEIVAYEPVFAVGTGTPDTPENAQDTASAIKEKGSYNVFYGGSVTAQNVKSFTGLENINGVVVGGASLEVEDFTQIIDHA